MNIFELRQEIEEQNHREAIRRSKGVGLVSHQKERFEKYLSYLGENKNVAIVDLGSGATSGFLRLLKAHGYRNICGLDLTKAAAEKAKKYGFEVLRGDIEKLDLKIVFRGKKFDFIIFGEIIEHLFYPEESLRKITRILKPNGRLILSTPNAGFWLNGIFLIFFPRYLHALTDAFSSKEHKYFFTIFSLERCLTEAGFEIEELTTLPNFHFTPVKKTLLIRLASIFLYSVYWFSGILSNLFPGVFGGYFIIKARLKNEKQNI